MNFYGWVSWVVSLQKEECLRLKNVVKLTYVCALAPGEALSFIFGELLILGEQKVSKKEKK